MVDIFEAYKSVSKQKDTESAEAKRYAEHKKTQFMARVNKGLKRLNCYREIARAEANRTRNMSADELICENKEMFYWGKGSCPPSYSKPNRKRMYENYLKAHSEGKRSLE